LLGEHRDLYGLLEELAPRPRRRLLGSCDHDVYGEDAQMMEGMNMPAVLEGKVALVTGVSYDGQIGQAVAKKLAESGAALAICARTQSNVEARAEELRQAGAHVLAVAASLTDEAKVRQLIERALSEYRRIDILVNLAGGLTRYKLAVEHSLDD
jgi:NADP-dependent 3-hydroxy acid dehydrogenase YdfG